MRASKPVQEPEPELVSAVKPLVLVLEQQLVQQLAVELLELEQVQVLEPLALVRELVWEPARVREPLTQRQELAALLEQARELRVSRQLELQQHRLPIAAQERLPYLPALPMKAPC